LNAQTSDSILHDAPTRTRCSPKIIVVFRNDDPSAISNLDHEREIFGIFERYGVPQTLAVIPRVAGSDHHDSGAVGEHLLSENPRVLEFLKDYATHTGSEVALHGYTHRANRFSNAARREYAEFKYLPLPEQQELIRLGLDIIEQSFGWRPVTFVPPWNRWDQNTLIACARNSCRIISAGPYVTASEELISFGSNTNLEDFSRDFQEARRSCGPVFLNVLFHSITVTPAQKELLVRALETVTRDPDCRVVTVSKAAELFGRELAAFNEAGRNVVPVYQVPDSPRARAWLYLSTLNKLCRFDPLKGLLSEAKALYRAGNYSSARALTFAIDSTCAKVLWTGRAATLATGCTIGAITAWFLQRTRVIPSVAIQCLILIAVGLGWFLILRQATSRDTRREVALLGCLATLGAVAAGLAVALLLKTSTS
jgi:predicted deacetylase